MNRTRFPRQLWLFVLLSPLAVACLGGCAESIAQYTSFVRPKGEAETTHYVMGGNREDSAAYAASGEQLTEADWATLEKVAPRSMWEKILRMKAEYERKKNAGRKKSEPEAPADGTTLPETPKPVYEPPVVEMADGMVHIIYKLHHYGGVGVQASRDGGTERRMVKTTLPDLKALVDMLGKQLGKNGTVSALPDENALAIHCAADRKDAIIATLAEVDQPAAQVQISARVFEVSHDFDFQYGTKTLMRHLSEDNSEAFASSFSPKAFADAVTNPFEGVVPDPGSALRLLKVFERAGVSLDMTFQALADTGLIKVVSEPRMTVASGETGYMLAGQELPIQSARISNDQFLSEKVTYKPVGIQLYITPRVIGGDSIKLHVVTIVSAISGFSPLPNIRDDEDPQRIVNPIIDSREAETSVTVLNGKTLVIGGMRMVRTIRRESKVPGLGDLEAIEWLFKDHRTQKQVTDLYFFVTPTVIEDES